MVCPKSLEVLQGILEVLKSQQETNALKIAYDGIWTIKTNGKQVVYSTTQTYDGNGATTGLTMQRDFPVGININRIDQIWNDGTAKDIYIRKYSDISDTYYTQMLSVTGDINPSKTTSPSTDNELYLPPNSRLRVLYMNYTQNKIVTLIITGTLP